MAALDIPVIYKDKAALIADDEPEHLEWLVDFLQSLGLEVTVVLNVADAMAACSKAWYRMYVIDLNIPLASCPEPDNAIYANYPGFAIIQGIRSQGNDGRRVIAYSAHLNDQIQVEMRRLYTDYIAKGRPIQLKDRIKELLALPDQTAAALKRVLAREVRRKAARAARRKARVTTKLTKKPPPGAAGAQAQAKKTVASKSPVGIGKRRRSRKVSSR